MQIICLYIISLTKGTLNSLTLHHNLVTVLMIAFITTLNFYIHIPNRDMHNLYVLSVSYNILLFSLSRLTQLQELNLDNNSKCRGAFSVIGEMASLRKLSFDVHRGDVDVIGVIFSFNVSEDDDDEDADVDGHSLFDLER